jgi:hypothetical protein
MFNSLLLFGKMDVGTPDVSGRWFIKLGRRGSDGFTAKLIEYFVIPYMV